MPVFGEFSEKKFTYTLNKLEDRYRNAIAHAHNDKNDNRITLLSYRCKKSIENLQYVRVLILSIWENVQKYIFTEFHYSSNVNNKLTNKQFKTGCASR